MLVKTLTRLGNSSALVIDRTLMNLMGIDPETPLKVTVEGRKLTVEPLSDKERAKQFTAAMTRTGRKNARLFRKLAK